jgi:lipid II:glycine glycyltransferase (peptidoglycan interpeptide bridge formation enzyme)
MSSTASSLIASRSTPTPMRCSARVEIARAARDGKGPARGRLATPGTDRAARREFYALHAQTSRRRAVPVQPKNFILRFEELFARPRLRDDLLPRRQGDHRGCLPHLRRNADLQYGAPDEEFLNLRPNHLLFAEAIRPRLRSGLRELDFGRTDPGRLARFKRSWAAQEEQLCYTYLADRPPKKGHGFAERVVGEAIRRRPP